MEPAANTNGFCRDCFASVELSAKRCLSCSGPRLLQHSELHHLSIAHIDCDAFYAAVEKRDRPELRDLPVIIGGGVRGVVSTACYIARTKGVKSAMPMFQALKLCPEAVVIKPDMQKYVVAGKAIRELMLELTPLVQPLSIDEAFLDLTGTERLHGASPALSLARLVKRIQDKIGVSVSVGLSHNKFLAKLSSDFQKPRGFSLIGKEETMRILAARPVSVIWGVGAAMQASLAKRGISMINQLQTLERDVLIKQFGQMGDRLYYLSRGQDYRQVHVDDEMKTISAETTFFSDIVDYENLEAKLWQQAKRVSARAKAQKLAGKTVTLKLKTAKFESRTRAASLQDATNLAHVIFDVGCQLLAREVGKDEFRLLGIGISRLEEEHMAEVAMLDGKHMAQTKIELAMDRLRGKFGTKIVDRGIGMRKSNPSEVDKDDD